MPMIVAVTLQVSNIEGAMQKANDISVRGGGGGGVGAAAPPVGKTIVLFGQNWCTVRANNIQTVSNSYGVDSEMLSSEKAIFENYNCGDPCQRQSAAVMVKAMHQNGLHEIFPVLYKVASILTTISATSRSAERSLSALRRIKTFLRSTMGRDRLSSIAVINIKRKYVNKAMQDDMQRIIDIFGRRSNRSSYFL